MGAKSEPPIVKLLTYTIYCGLSSIDTPIYSGLGKVLTFVKNTAQNGAGGEILETHPKRLKRAFFAVLRAYNI